MEAVRTPWIACFGLLLIFGFIEKLSQRKFFAHIFGYSLYGNACHENATASTPLSVPVNQDLISALAVNLGGVPLKYGITVAAIWD